MKSVLITGAAGNIGSALVKALLDRGTYSVVGVDDLSTGSRAKLPDSGPNFRFIKANVNDWKDISPVFSVQKFDYVFHFAAVVGVLRTLSNPLSVLRDIDGIKNVLSLAKNTAAERVFFSSSSEVYGEPVSVPQNEESTPLNSRLPYAIVKNLGEAYFRSYNDEHGLSYTIFRFFNTYGPNQSEDFVVPRFLKAAMAGEPISVYGDGLQSRTFLYIDDNVETMVRCMENASYVNDVLNIGSDVEMSVVDLAKLIIDEVGSTSRIIHLPPLKEGDMRRRQPDIDKMKGVLNRPLLPVREGVRRLINHYRDLH